VFRLYFLQRTAGILLHELSLICAGTFQGKRALPL
jgi:hypothetical protein